MCQRNYNDENVIMEYKSSMNVLCGYLRIRLPRTPDSSDRRIRRTKVLSPARLYISKMTPLSSYFGYLERILSVPNEYELSGFDFSFGASLV